MFICDEEINFEKRVGEMHDAIKKIEGATTFEEIKDVFVAAMNIGTVAVDKNGVAQDQPAAKFKATIIESRDKGVFDEEPGHAEFWTVDIRGNDEDTLLELIAAMKKAGLGEMAGFEDYDEDFEIDAQAMFVTNRAEGLMDWGTKAKWMKEVRRIVRGFEKDHN